MITYADGDIFQATTQTIVNPINCEGAMGAGLAVLFRHKFPGLYNDYLNKYKANLLKIGEPYLWKSSDSNIQWVLNFPTKDKWQDPSKIEYIKQGLSYFMNHYQEWGISSITFPSLGMGLGGLSAKIVYSVMDSYLKDISIPCYIYKPRKGFP